MEKTQKLSPLLELEGIILNWFAEEKTKFMKNAASAEASSESEVKETVQKSSYNGCRKAPLFAKQYTILYVILLMAAMAYAYLLVFSKEVCHAGCNNSCILLIAVLVLATIVLIFLWNCHIRLCELESQSAGTSKDRSRPVSFRDALDRRLSDEYIDSFVKKVVKEYSGQNKSVAQ